MTVCIKNRPGEKSFNNCSIYITTYALIAASGLATVASISKIASAKAPKTPKFFYGGPTGTKPALGNDEYGAVTGYLHKNEYVIPEVMTQDPQFADTISWLENNRQRKLRGFVDGGEVEEETLHTEGKGHEQGDIKEHPEQDILLGFLHLHIDPAGQGK